MGKPDSIILEWNFQSARGLTQVSDPEICLKIKLKHHLLILNEHVTPSSQ